ncbi:Uncharacterised protein [Bordetella pertussis]|nr:Uncharacterised protein [Bordetella pertussis]
MRRAPSRRLAALAARLPEPGPRSRARPARRQPMVPFSSA